MSVSDLLVLQYVLHLALECTMSQLSGRSSIKACVSLLHMFLLP